MTDRERRLVRAAARLAVAARCLEEAAVDLWACRQDLGEIADRRRHSLLWMIGEVNRELRKPARKIDTTATDTL